MQELFWVSALFIAYVYLGYGVLLVLWARVARGRSARLTNAAADLQVRDVAGSELPSVSIIIAARNEADRLPARIDNLLALDYPAERRQIIIVSDGFERRHGVGACPVRRPGPPGRHPASRQGRRAERRRHLCPRRHSRLRRCTPDICADALRRLVAPFADPGVGGVSGELILGAETDAGRRRRPRRRREVEEESLDYERRVNDRRLASTVCDGVGFYWKYEKLLRRLETEVGSMLGATGAIYALRRSLWRSLPPGTILDDVLAPMRAVLAGHRIVFEPAARAFDYMSPDAGAESRRKVRTLAGNVQILWFEPRLLVPILNPVWAAVRLAQDRPPARALRPDGALRLEPRAVGNVDVVHIRAVRAGGVLSPRRVRCLARTQDGGGAGRPVAGSAHGRSGFHHRGDERVGSRGAGAALLGRKVWR
jgi:cellulose synthase/poly-beta-1,6-N-acetylglucosamine synthase-like glycosyltransferase